MTRIIDVQAVVSLCATQVRRKFSGYVDREDLVSEAQLWILEHPRTMNEYLEDEDIKRAHYRLTRDVTITMEVFARKEKAQKLGYDPEDEQYYSSVLVAALLPAVVLGQLEPPPVESDGSQATTDPAEGGSWMAARADVARAWEQAALSEQDRLILQAYYVEGYDQGTIGQFHGLARQTVGERLKKGMRKIVRELGGERPKGCPFDCECHDAPLRRRPSVHSNHSGSNQAFN